MTVFDRLYQSHTASSRAKRQANAERVSSSSSSSAKAKATTYPRSPAASAGTTATSTTSSSPSSPALSTTSTVGAGQATASGGAATGSATDDENAEDGDGDDRDPHAATTDRGVRLELREKGKSSDFHEMDPKSLSGIQRVLRDYASGGTSEKQVAVALTEALWVRDFSPGKHWDIDGTSVREIKPGEMDDTPDGSSCWTIEKSATWDWKDIYSVARVEGRVRFLPFVVRVEDYLYYAAG